MASDASNCKGVFLVAQDTPPNPQLVSSLQSDIAKLGITARVVETDNATLQVYYGTPAKKVEIGTTQWSKDFPDMSTYLEPLFASIGSAGGNVNFAMVSNASITRKIASCGPLSDGNSRYDCWNAVDKNLMEHEVPWIPFMWLNAVRVFSTNIATLPPPYTQWGFGSTPLDQLALTPAAIAKTRSELGRP